MNAGTKVGPYEVLSSLGAGGMGEVYRARDTKLNRDVALKVLPEALSHDSERMARFKREAQVLASLNHPNIATIHGLEESGGVRALVMELVEGQTLAEIIATRQAVPVSEALPIAWQIAEALEYAHERAIIHRDLKPANVKVTPEGTVKVLDFGLAKALDVDPASSSSNVSNSPTLTVAATQTGVIIGTAAYMSPEQARGKAADRRADIWSFGCVLYEMLSGKRTFEGDTVSDTLAAVLKSEPDWDAIPPETPPAIQKLIRRCLVKDPKQRLQAIGDARITMEEAISGAGADDESLAGAGGETPPLKRALPWALGIACVVLAAALVTLAVTTGVFKKSVPRVGEIRFDIRLPDGYQLAGSADRRNVSVSPNGRMIAFVAADSKQVNTLWVRSLDARTAQRLDHTDGANVPFWSPDSQSIAYFTNDDKLMRIPTTGGAPQTVCVAKKWAGGTWGKGGVILFGQASGPIMRVAATGGEPVPVTEFDKSKYAAHAAPSFLPDGKHFLYLAARFASNDIYSGSLESKQSKLGLKNPTWAQFYPPNHMLFVRGGTLLAQKLDPDSMELSGEPVKVAENVGWSGWGSASFSSSLNGILAYRAEGGGNVVTAQLAWYNREGKKLSNVGPPGPYSQAMLSPDEKRVAVNVSGGPNNTANYSIWLLDLTNGVFSRVTFDSDVDNDPVWSSDSREFDYVALKSGKAEFMQLTLGGTQPKKLFTASGTAYLDDISPDGKFVVYKNADHSAFIALPLTGEQKPIKLVENPFIKDQLHFSPDGKWVAYNSNESGRTEVYVASFPNMDQKRQVSTEGGGEPMWRRDGKELFYLSLDNKMMVVSVKEGETLETGPPKELFQANVLDLFGAHDGTDYNVSRDGQRFLLLEPVKTQQAQSTEPIHVIVNWDAALSEGGNKASDSR